MNIRSSQNSQLHLFYSIDSQWNKPECIIFQMITELFEDANIMLVIWSNILLKNGEEIHNIFQDEAVIDNNDTKYNSFTGMVNT